MASTKFAIPLWLKFGLIMCLVCVQYTLAKGPVKLEKLMKERHCTEKNTPLDLAWRTNEIWDALSEMGFNATRCKERHWKKYVAEPDRQNGTFRRVIRRLCKRYLLPNDADRLEAHRKYLAQVGRKYKFDEMVKLILGKLADYNETREHMLNENKFVIDKSNTDCYWKTYYSFAETCTDPNFDYRVLGIRNIFANACLAPWLNPDKIKQCFKEVCSNFDLYV